MSFRPVRAIRTRAAPTVPTNIVLAAGNARLTATWDPPINDGGRAVTHYRTTIKAAGAVVASTVTLVSVEQATFDSTDGIANGTAYVAYVEASNDGGTNWGTIGGPSNTATPATITASPPSAPQTLAATGGTVRVVTSWTAPSSNGGSAITGYRIRLIRHSDSAVMATKLVAASVLTTTFTAAHGVVINTAYDVTAEATNDSGNTWGTVAGPTAMTGTVTPPRPTAPAPIGLIAGNATVATSWTYPNDFGYPVTHYRVRLRRDDNNALVKETIVAAPALSLTFDATDSVVNGTAYVTYAAASNDGGTFYGAEAGPSNPGTPQGVPGLKLKATMMGGSHYNSFTVAQRVADINELAATWGSSVRVEHNITSPANAIDYLLTEIVNSGLRHVLIQENYFPPLNPDGTDWNGVGPAPEKRFPRRTDEGIYRTKWRALANHYKAFLPAGMVIVLEFCNEPNLNTRSINGTIEVAEYCFWLRVLTESFRSVQPSIKILAGGFAVGPTNKNPAVAGSNLYGYGYNPSQRRQWSMTDYIIDATNASIVGAANTLQAIRPDYIGMHPYNNSPLSLEGGSVGVTNQQTAYNGMRQLSRIGDHIAAIGLNVEIWPTEWGYPTAPAFHNDGRLYPARTVLFPNEGTQNGDLWNRPQLYVSVRSTTTRPGTSGDWVNYPSAANGGTFWNAGEDPNHIHTENEAYQHLWNAIRIMAGLRRDADNRNIGAYIGRQYNFLNRDHTNGFTYGLKYLGGGLKGLPTSRGPLQAMVDVAALNDPR